MTSLVFADGGASRWIGFDLVGIPRALGILALALSMTGCSEREPASPEAVVVVSVLPQAFFVETLAGDTVRVEVMIPPGASPATYEPTMEQLKALSQARLYVKVGHPHFAFEKAWLDRVLDDRPDLQVVDSSEGIELLKSDPHVWVAPSNARTLTLHIATALEEQLPGERERIAARSAELLSRIEDLDRDLHERFEGVRGRRIFVYHPAWAYFAREYGLVQVALEQGGKEPDIGAINAFIEQARVAKTKVIFIQPQFSRQSAELVAQAVGARLEVVDPLARDWAENLRRVGAAFARAVSE